MSIFILVVDLCRKMWKYCRRVTSEPHRSIQGEAEGFSDGSACFCGGGPKGVGSVLDGGAAAVDGIKKGVAVDAGKFLVLGGVLLEILGAEVGFEQRFDGGDFFRGLEAGERVGLGAGDEGVRALAEDGAAGIEAAADEVAIGGEMGGGIAVLGEHLVLLLGGTLDPLEGGDELGGGIRGIGGGLFGLAHLLAGGGGALAGLGEGGLEFDEPGGSDVVVGHFCRMGAGGGEDGVSKV